ncbi:epidermal retinol dehydrogenase 2-like [Acanthaster planci]|uniref:Short-chain dehydrogenase/reductase 3 n=1 Tax=Acanthaster planci TaxID=133434 RepID=A0A8B7XT13_ACAPL|nr:epidermal retinol dehydrogenase 2-like [Acanthaster planci]
MSQGAPSDEFSNSEPRAHSIFSPFSFVSLFIELLVLFHRVAVAVLRGCFRFVFPRAPKNIVGRNVLVTGAANNIGCMLAWEFALRGANLILVDLDAEGCVNLASDIQDIGQAVKVYKCDLTKREEINRVMCDIMRDVGKVDILVNNAGIVSARRLLDCPDAVIQRVMDLNIMASIWMTKAVLPGMLQRNYGHIVNIASLSGYIGIGGLVDLSTSKFACVGFSEALDLELKQIRKDIKVSVVCPSLLDRGMFEGAKSRFPSPLKPQYAVSEIMRGVLTDREVIFIPWYMQFTPIFKAILPVGAFSALLDFSTGMDIMKNIKGSRKTSLL